MFYFKTKKSRYNFYFAGNFIRNHEETMDNINHAFEFFSNKDEDKKIAVFLSHDGYLGALGSLLFYEAERKGAKLE